MARGTHTRVFAGVFLGLSIATGLGLTLMVPGQANAEPHFFNRPKEMFMLPEYCRYTQDFRDHVPGGKNQPEIDRWYKLMGQEFHHMHHYCYALQAVNRASFMSRTEEEIKHNLYTSVRECDYVIRNTASNPSFSMLPDILTTKGQSLMKLGEVGQGMQALERAIEMRADFWPAYAAIGDYYKEVGNTAKAREWLEKGLAVTPNNRPLTRRLSALNPSEGRRASRP